MNYTNYSPYTSNTYTPVYQQQQYTNQRQRYNHLSKSYTSKRQDINNQLQYMLQNQRKKFKQANNKYQQDLDNQRKIRIQFQNKLIKLKDQFSRNQIHISQMEFKLNNLLQQNHDIIIENQKLKSQLNRLEDIYTNKIKQLQTQLNFETQSFQQTTIQYNNQFDKFKHQGQQYVQQLTFQFQRKIKTLQEKLKLTQNSKKEISIEVKKLNDILVSNKLNFEQEIRDLKNKFRDQEIKINTTFSKSFQTKIKMIEESKQILLRKNRELLKALQDKDKKLGQMQSEFRDQISRVQNQKIQQSQQIKSLNYLVGKLKSQISQKDAILGHRVNDNQGQILMIRNELNSKRQEINRLVSINQSLKITIKQVQNDQQRKRRQLIEKCAIWQGQARKYKQQYTRICDVLKSKINDTINNVGRAR